MNGAPNASVVFMYGPPVPPATRCKGISRIGHPPYEKYATFLDLFLGFPVLKKRE